jgi:PHP family Zn ribbon phosphoesterase
LDLDEDHILKISTPEIAQAIIRVRQGQVRVEGGYDGVFGKIHIYEGAAKDRLAGKPKQKELF